MDKHIRDLQAEEAAMQMTMGMENDQFAMALVFQTSFINS